MGSGILREIIQDDYVDMKGSHQAYGIGSGSGSGSASVDERKDATTESLPPLEPSSVHRIVIPERPNSVGLPPLATPGNGELPSLTPRRDLFNAKLNPKLVSQLKLQAKRSDRTPPSQRK